MNKVFDYSELMMQTRAVQVILDRPRFMRYDLAAIKSFEARFGMTVSEWLKAIAAKEVVAIVDDQYFIAWIGFLAEDPELSLNSFSKAIPYPAINALFNGPILLALTGLGAAEGNLPRAAGAGRLPSMRSRGTLWGWLRRKRGHQPQKK
jgi:hypothetical protein